VKKPRPRRTPAGEMLLASELGREGRIFEERDVIRLLKWAIEREGDQTSFARRHGIDRTHLNQILNRKKQINRAVMKALGLRKVFSPE
jgi:DNA-binding phage protein